MSGGRRRPPAGGPPRLDLAAVVEALDVGVVVIAPPDRVQLVNGAAADLLDVRRPLAAPRPLVEVIRQPSLLALVEAVLAGGTVSRRRVTLVVGGEERELAVSASRLPAAGKGKGDLLLALHDVTRLSRLETVRREFVANVSHELKTPVTSIRGFSELLIAQPDLPPAERARYLGVVYRQAERLGVIIEDLLTLSRLERDPGVLRELIADQPLRPLLEAAVAGCPPPAGDPAQPPPVIRCPDDLRWPVAGDLLEQAVFNLVDNAHKHAGAAEPVLVEALVVGDELRISVIDRGRGIASSHLPRLFERFYRVNRDRSRRRGGTGLGLAIVKHIVRVHGGNVTVASEPGRGTTFTLLLPRPS